LHYRNRPGWNDHNELGMRDQPVGEKDKFRLLLIGDSIGYYGDSMDDTYPGQLEARLNDDTSLEPSEVLNASTKGYTTYQELLFLKKYGLSLQPDGIALGFCVNDLHRFLHQFDVVDGKIVPGTYVFTQEAAAIGLPAVAQHSMFLSWIWAKGRAAMTQIGLRPGTLFECRADIGMAWQDDHWPIFEEQLKEMADLARERNIPLFLIAFPHALQYREDYLQANREYVLKPQHRLRVICQRLQVPLIDLYSTLSAHQFVDDGIHLTADERAQVAEAIATFVAQRGLVPPRGAQREGIATVR
jgi:lysophospholipase L1-like esterase